MSEKRAVSELAELLGISTKPIYESLEMLEQGEAYRVWSIPKKSGGEREIQAALQPLRGIQAGVAALIYPYSVSNINHSFVHRRNHKTAALPHLSANAMFCFDIRDAFPSIKKASIESRLYLDCGFSRALATLIAELVCFPEGDFLPQGYCSSPYIFNLVLRPVDRILEGFAQVRDYTITRYVDNFALSANRQIPEENRDLAIGIVKSWLGVEIPPEKISYFKGVPFELLELKIFEENGQRKLAVVEEKLADCIWAIYEAIVSGDYSKKTDRRVRGKLGYLKSIYGTESLPERVVELYREYQHRGQLSLNL